ncbi:probetacellulin isoform 2-T4 [Theristicus caerulescens]
MEAAAPAPGGGPGTLLLCLALASGLAFFSCVGADTNVTAGHGTEGLACGAAESCTAEAAGSLLQVPGGVQALLRQREMPLPRGREGAGLRVRARLHGGSLREGGHLLPARRPGPDRDHLLDRRHRHPHHPHRLRLPLQSPLSEAA